MLPINNKERNGSLAQLARLDRWIWCVRMRKLPAIPQTWIVVGEIAHVSQPLSKEYQLGYAKLSENALCRVNNRQHSR